MVVAPEQAGWDQKIILLVITVEMEPLYMYQNTNFTQTGGGKGNAVMEEREEDGQIVI